MGAHARRQLLGGLTALAAIGLLGSRVDAAPTYSVTALGSDAWTLLNNNGQTAGSFTSSHAPSYDSFTEIYDPNVGGRVSFLGITPPSSSGPGSYDFPSQPLSMNDAGQLIIQRSVGNIPFEYDHGKTTPLPGWGVAINNSGQVAGYDGYNRPGLGSEQAYIQSKGVTTQLGVLPGAEESIPVAINN
jgi:hypothetical protein